MTADIPAVLWAVGVQLGVLAIAAGICLFGGRDG